MCTVSTLRVWLWVACILGKLHWGTDIALQFYVANLQALGWVQPSYGFIVENFLNPLHISKYLEILLRNLNFWPLWNISLNNSFLRIITVKSWGEAEPLNRTPSCCHSLVSCILDFLLDLHAYLSLWFHFSYLTTERKTCAN